MHYYPEDQSDENLKKIRSNNVCAVCGRQLYIYIDLSDLGARFTNTPRRKYIACSGQVHEGIAREYQASPLEEKGLDALTLKAKEETMNERYGERKSTALAKTGVPLSGALTQSQAMEILKLVYPDVPENEVIRTAMLCRDFGLHPLMKEVYIIPFGQGDKRTWSTVLGINATRKMMARMGSFSYMDNTPRVMTEQEQKVIFGEVASDRIYAITKLQTKGGLNAQGYGNYLLKDTPYGMDKGNTKANMAFIRSERQAFSRLFPDAIPQELEVIDEAYVEGVGAVDRKTGEVIEGESRELEPEEKAGPKAKSKATATELKSRVSGEHGVFQKEAPNDPLEPDTDGTTLDETPITDEQVEHLVKFMNETGMTYTDLAQFCNREKGWNIRDFKTDLKQWQYLEIVASFEKGKG